MSIPKITILANIPPSNISKKIVFYAKSLIKKTLGRVRGPDAVLESFVRGLTEKSIPFIINPKKPTRLIHAISGVESLKKALQLKSQGLADKVIAGPNISILPIYDDRILLDPLIDVILVPSNWVKEAYIKADHTLLNKIVVWPSGVNIPESSTSRDGPMLVFKKSVPDEIFIFVIKTLESLKVNYKVIEYGTYSKKEYFEMLKVCPAMIYLQESESQGLALQEAWSFNVPTLVWNIGSFTYPGTQIKLEGKVSAPYLDPTCGSSFHSTEDFSECLLSFKNSLSFYTPKTYCRDSLSDTASIDLYLKIVNNVINQH